MSYSFNVRAASKSLVKALVAAELEKVAVHQACHQRDNVQAQAAADAFVDVLTDDDDKDVVVNMSGYLTGQWQGSDVTRIEGASVSVSAGLAKREAMPG